MTTLTTKTSASELRTIATELGLTLVGNARLKATKIEWIAQIEAARGNTVEAPTQAVEPTTQHVTVKQAVKAAESLGYSLEIDRVRMKINIKAENVIQASVWLTSDVMKWLQTAEIKPTIVKSNGIMETSRPEITLVVDNTMPRKAQAPKDQAVETPSEAVKEVELAPKTTKGTKATEPQVNKESIRQENERLLAEINKVFEFMPGLAIAVTDWLTFEAKIYQGKKELGKLGINTITGKPWYRPQAPEVGKSVKFPVDTLESAVCKLVVFHTPVASFEEEDEEQYA